MNGFPDWWLYVSGAFFMVNLILFGVLAYFVVNLVKWMHEMKPKIEAISTRVEAIGKNVEELTEHVKSTAESVGGKAKSVATSVDSIAQLASSTFERFSPYVMGALTAMKLFSGFMQMRRSMAPAKQLPSVPEKKAKRGKATAA